MSRFGEPKVTGSMNRHTVVKCKQFLGTVRVSDIYKLWEQTFCPACVYTCVGSSLIIRVFIVHVSIDCQTVRISLVK